MWSAFWSVWERMPNGCKGNRFQRGAPPWSGVVLSYLFFEEVPPALRNAPSYSGMSRGVPKCPRPCSQLCEARF